MKLVSLNIERSKHLERVIPFLREQDPDIVCLQELCERDAPRFMDLFPHGSHIFVPAGEQFAEDEWRVEGEGIFSRVPFEATAVKHYSRAGEELPKWYTGNPATFTDCDRAAAFADIILEEKVFRVGCTHFTWSAKGEATDVQRADMRKLLSILEESGEFVLCGDFNAPRILDGKPGEIYSMIAAKYQDNIPEKYVTSLDVQLHRAGKEKPHEIDSKIVDYIFSTSGYTVSDVELVFGVSDHAAVVATVLNTQATAH